MAKWLGMALTLLDYSAASITLTKQFSWPLFLYYGISDLAFVWCQLYVLDRIILSVGNTLLGILWSWNMVFPRVWF